MNLVGKILTVLILVMAVFFSALAVMNYAAKRNWMLIVTNPPEKATPELPKGLKYRLDDALADNQELRDQLDNLTRRLDNEREFALQTRAKLETANQILATQNKQFQVDLDQRSTQLNEAVADVKVTHEALARLRNDVDTLRADIRTTRQDKEVHFKEVVRLTAELHNAANELARVREIHQSLSEDLAKAMEVLRKFGLKPEPEVYTGQAPQVDGVVLAVLSDGLVEISIGADDGLLEGHQLDVYRTVGGVSTYVGRIEVVRTAPDKCVCKVDPKYLKSPVVRGDRVASKIQ